MIDRPLLRRLLEAMNDSPVDGVHLDGFENREEADLMRHLSYLEEHRLCQSGISPGMTGARLIKPSKITARGADFLEEDGGLTAQLGIVTVQLDVTKITALLDAKIDKSDATPAEKATIKEHISKLPAVVLQALTTDLIRVGLAHAPDAIGLLRTYAGL